MGARISIELQGLLNNADIKLAFHADSIGTGRDQTVIQLVDVRFLIWAADNQDAHRDADEFDYTFDVVSYNSKVTLEKDFNFFRDEKRHSELMRCLFEHSVPFTVLPG